MKQEAFIYWLQGMLEGNPKNKEGLTAEQVAIIQQHLNLVLTKVTIPPLTDYSPLMNPDIKFTPVPQYPQNPFGPGQLICSGGGGELSGTVAVDAQGTLVDYGLGQHLRQLAKGATAKLC